MPGLPWSTEELADLARLSDTDFATKYPRRSYHARRVKRQDMRRAAGGELTDPATVVGVLAGEGVDLDQAMATASSQYARLHTERLRKQHQHLYLPGPAACLVVLSDQHFGAPGTDVTRAFAEAERVLDTPHTYVLLGGDLVDNMIVGKLLGKQMFTNTTQAEAWALAREYVHGFGHRVVGAVSGNHTKWTLSMIGLDIDRAICPEGALYDTDDLLVTVHVGATDVLLRLRHKWPGNSMYNPTHAMERAARFDNSDPDVYIGGHVHKGAMAREFTLAGRRKLAMLAGTYKAIDDYARTEGFPASDGSTAAALVIDHHGWWGTGNLDAALAYMRSTVRA